MHSDTVDDRYFTHASTGIDVAAAIYGRRVDGLCDQAYSALRRKKIGVDSTTRPFRGCVSSHA